MQIGNKYVYYPTFLKERSTVISNSKKSLRRANIIIKISRA